MNQMRWVFIDDYGNRHRVGLLHGEKTGHVVIHCNDEISLIDFSIKESKDYNVMINEQLCTVSIQKNDDKYSYGFTPDYEADIPLNRLRRRVQKKHRRQSLMLGLGFILLLGAVYWGYMSYQSPSSAANRSYPISSEAKVVAVGGIDDPHLSWEARIEGKRISGTLRKLADSEVALRMLPYQEGDRLDLLISNLEPLTYDLDTRPEMSSLKELAGRVSTDITERYPLIESHRLQCMIDDACEDGHSGLAALIHVLRSIHDNTLPPARDARAYEILVQACR